MPFTLEFEGTGFFVREGVEVQRFVTPAAELADPFLGVRGEGYVNTADLQSWARIVTDHIALSGEEVHVRTNRGWLEFIELPFGDAQAGFTLPYNPGTEAPFIPPEFLGAPALAADFIRANLEHLLHADVADLSFTGDFTIVQWIRLKTKAGFIQASMGKGTFGQFEYVIGYSPTPDRFTFGVSPDGTGGAASNILANVIIPAIDTWYMLVATHVDGVEQRFQINRIAPESVAYTAGIHSGTASFAVGANFSGLATHCDILSGPLCMSPSVLSDDVLDSLYNGGVGKQYADLTATERALFKQSGGTDGDLWWDLGEASGVRASASGNFDLSDVNTVGSAPGVS